MTRILKSGEFVGEARVNTWLEKTLDVYSNKLFSVVEKIKDKFSYPVTVFASKNELEDLYVDCKKFVETQTNLVGNEGRVYSDKGKYLNDNTNLVALIDGGANDGKVVVMVPMTVQFQSDSFNDDPEYQEDIHTQLYTAIIDALRKTTKKDFENLAIAPCKFMDFVEEGEYDSPVFVNLPVVVDGTWFDENSNKSALDTFDKNMKDLLMTYNGFLMSAIINDSDLAELVEEGPSGQNDVNNGNKDIVDYASKYGNEALGYAIADLVRRGELTLSNEVANLVWEYGGNNGNAE